LDHFRLNKFAEPLDGNFKAVAGELARFCAFSRQIKQHQEFSHAQNPAAASVARVHEAAAREKEISEWNYRQSVIQALQALEVAEPEKLVPALPSDRELGSLQEINDKISWFKSQLTFELQDCRAGFSERIIDDIVNAGREMIVIDGVRHECTRMAARWVDSAALEQLELPYIVDPVGATCAKA
jgi:hypothetical protein